MLLLFASFAIMLGVNACLRSCLWEEEIGIDKDKNLNFTENISYNIDTWVDENIEPYANLHNED